MMIKERNVNFRLDENSLNRLTVIAEKQDRNISQLMRLLVREFLNDHGNGKQGKESDDSNR